MPNEYLYVLENNYLYELQNERLFCTRHDNWTTR
jgi:hypothetical protein